MPTINLGRVGFVNKGDYIGGTTAYKINDVVTYGRGVFACIQAHSTEQLPDPEGDTAYWQVWVITPAELSAVFSQLVDGEFTLSNTVEKLVDTTVLYTGNGGTQNITTGISTIDFTVSSNGTGYWLDRSVPAVKTDAGTVIGTGEIDFADVVGVDGVSKVHIKCREFAHFHEVYDGLRGATKVIYTNDTGAEGTVSGLTGFTSTGFSLGSDVGANNGNPYNYVAYQTLYTHISWGTTNQGKFYVTAFNSQSLAEMTYYIGSGIEGHKIPTRIGRELAYWEKKHLNLNRDWYVGTSQLPDYYGSLSNNSFFVDDGGTRAGASTDKAYIDNQTVNNENEPIILYGFANAHYNDDGDRVGSYETGTYVGTGAAGNKITTAGKPASITLKRIDDTSSWLLFDNQRSGFDRFLRLDTSDVEGTADNFDISSDGFTFKGSSQNEVSSRYLYIVSYDTKLNGGGSYEDIPTNTTNLQLSNGLVSVTDGYDANGLINSIISKDGTITLPSISAAGDYWPYVDDTGAVSVSAYEPAWSDSNADGFRPVLNQRDMKWYEDYAVFRDEFSTDTSSNYTGRFGNETITVINRELKVEAGQIGGLAWSSALTGLTVGKRYKLPVEAKGVDTRVLIAEDTAFTNPQTLVEYQAVGAFNPTFIATAATMYIAFGNGQSVGATSYYPYWSLIPLNDDGSIDYSSATDMGSVGWLGNINVDADGSVQRVEQLPRTTTSEVVEAEKIITPKIEGTPQTATAWLSFDQGTNPPTIKDSFNIAGIRTLGLGHSEIMFEEKMDITDYIVVSTTEGDAGDLVVRSSGWRNKTTTSVEIIAKKETIGSNNSKVDVVIYGGKNV